MIFKCVADQYRAERVLINKTNRVYFFPIFSFRFDLTDLLFYLNPQTLFLYQVFKIFTRLTFWNPGSRYTLYLILGLNCWNSYTNFTNPSTLLMLSILSSFWNLFLRNFQHSPFSYKKPTLASYDSFILLWMNGAFSRINKPFWYQALHTLILTFPPRASAHWTP